LERRRCWRGAAPNFVFRVRFQLDVVSRIEAVNGGDQPDGSRGNQIVQVDALRKPFMNSPGNQPDLRQMFENQAFPLLAGVHPRLVLFPRPGGRFGRASCCIHTP
jgi:hypothetical protein